MSASTEDGTLKAQKESRVETPSPKPKVDDEQGEEEARFTADEEAELLSESDTLRQQANAFFPTSPSQALSSYEQALSVLPTYTFHLARAVLHSNMAAAHLRLSAWDDASKRAAAALDLLKELEGSDPSLAPEGGEEQQQQKKDGKSGKTKEDEEEDNDVEEEIISSGAEKAEKVRQEELSPLRADILRIRTKSLLRRARARAELGGWHNLSSSLEDYKLLSRPPFSNLLTPGDRRTVSAQLGQLPARVKEAQEQEVGEMWGKLKGLGDGLLKPFGLSTDNFKMIKDDATGGYSVNFSQN